MAVSWSTIVSTISDQTIPSTPVPPYTVLPGSGPQGASGTDPNALLAADAKTRFPSYTWKPGDPLKPPAGKEPSGFGMNPSYDQFAGWTSDWQAYMMDLWRNQTGSYASVTLTDTGGVSHRLIRSLETTKVFVMDQLQKRDFAAMSKADQENIAADDYYKTTLANTLGFTMPDPGNPGVTLTDPTKIKEALQTVINSKIGAVNSSAQNESLLTATYANDTKAFVTEYRNMLKRLDSMGIYNPNDVLGKVNEIETRYNRLREFALGYARNSPDSKAGLYNGINISVLDKGESFKRGYDVFAAQEKRMAELESQRLRLADEGTIGSKALDAPTLVYLFQQYTMLQTEAENNALSEEVNQFNAVLKVYQAMQQKINEIVKTFEPNKSDQRRNWNGSTDENQNVSTLAPSDLTLLRIFETGGNGIHPMEFIYKISRPSQDMVGSSGDRNNKLNVFFRDGWNAFANQLGDKITQFNQESQILMNKVNSKEKEKNRYFEQANGALSKLYDVMNSVARSI